jgi:outer membrane protein
MTKRLHTRLLPAALALLLAPALAPAEDLMASYEAARQSDPTLAIAEAQKLSTDEGVNQATSQLLPQITGSFSYTDSHGYSQGTAPRDDGTFGTVPIISHTDNDRSTTLRGTLTQSIIDFSKWTQRKAAQEQARRGDATYQAAEQTLLIRVSTAYFAVLTAEDSLAFSQSEEKALARQLDQANQRYEVGLSAITDVNEAKAKHDSATADVINAQNALDDAREALREITGKEPGDLKRLREKLPLTPPEGDAQKWVDSAMAQNPTLIAQVHAYEAAKANVNTARSGHLPTLSGSITYTNSPNWADNSSDSFPGIQHTNSQRGDTAIGFTLSVPIFSGGYTQSRVRQAVHDRDAAEDTLEQQKRAVVRATRNNYRAVIAGISGVEARKQAVISANSALEATQAGFEVGTRTIVDVLISQQQLFQAQRDYSQARHDFVLNGLKLRQSAGNIEPKDLEAVNALLE